MFAACTFRVYLSSPISSASGELAAPISDLSSKSSFMFIFVVQTIDLTFVCALTIRFS